MSTPTTPNDPVGTVRQDPESKLVAVRINDGLPAPYMMVTLDRGGHYADQHEIDALAGWPVLSPNAKAKATRR